jgi:hypothetical protein
VITAAILGAFVNIIPQGVLKACPFLPHIPHLRASGLTSDDISLWFHLVTIICKKNSMIHIAKSAVKKTLTWIESLAEDAVVGVCGNGLVCGVPFQQLLKLRRDFDSLLNGVEV